MPMLWDSIPEEEPDEWDKQMLEQIKNDPDCHTFASEEEVKKLFEDI